ncbi:MAG TPA: histidine phosphatase family protein, partial [Solirubrobacterales bacterium]
MADRDSFEQSPYELPPGSTEVVLVRHGASEAAVVGSKFPLVDGHSNPALSESGLRQAETVAERL